MRKGDTIPGILVTIFGLAFLLGTISSPMLKFGSTTSDGVPGAGFFPYILSITTIVLGIVLTVKGLKQKNGVQYIKVNDELKSNFKILGLTVVGLLAFLVLWQVANQFYLSVLLFCLYCNRIFKRTWKFTAVYSTIFTAFIYVVFSVGFSVQFH